MKRNKMSPIKSKLNLNKKTKVQFSTRLSSCLGEHQSQEFFERLNITRQSGICSKNKNNSFGDNKSHSFRQTLQLNIPFVADLSDFKQLCICYPVHFFRRKLHSYDSEDSRLASVRVYYPATRMKYGNEFKVSMDLKKRYHLQPHQYEFVAYSSLLTISLEDLALAVFRAKSLAEKFKIVHSLPIPKFLLSSNNISSQIGTPIFIGTERIYSRLSKLITCSQNISFQLNNSLTSNSDSDMYLKKCILKWVGICDFLPLSSRLIFVRRVSGDSGYTLGCSILNSPGPKIRRSRIKEGDKFSIRLKQYKFENVENDDSKSNLLIEPIALRVKHLNSRFQNSKRPRGRPKKSLNISDENTSEYPDDNSTSLLAISTDNIEEKVKIEPQHLKTESVSNSLVDSTSEEKYSVHLSTCSTPDTIKSGSPIALSRSLTTAVVSTASISQMTPSINENKLVLKNKRGRPRKYPSNVQDDSNIRLTLSKNKSGNFEVLSKSQDDIENDDVVIIRKRSSNNSFSSSEPNSKVLRVSELNLPEPNEEISEIRKSNIDSSNQSMKSISSFHNNQCLNFLVHSMWKPLKYPLPPPDPVVPFIKLISNTGIDRNSQKNCNGNQNKLGKSPHNDNVIQLPPLHQSSIYKIDNSQNLSTELSLQSNKSESGYIQSNHNLSESIPNKLNSKEKSFQDDNNVFSSNQYLIQSNILNQLLLPPNPSTLSHNNSLGILSPYFNNIHNPINGAFNNLASPVTVTSMFPLLNPNNSLQFPTSLSLPSQILCDATGNLLFSSTNSHATYNQNPVLPNCSVNHQANLQHPSYNHILLASKFEQNNSVLSWNNGFQWKY